MLNKPRPWHVLAGISLFGAAVSVTLEFPGYIWFLATLLALVMTMTNWLRPGGPVRLFEGGEFREDLSFREVSRDVAICLVSALSVWAGVTFALRFSPDQLEELMTSFPPVLIVISVLIFILTELVRSILVNEGL